MWMGSRESLSLSRVRVLQSVVKEIFSLFEVWFSEGGGGGVRAEWEVGEK